MALLRSIGRGLSSLGADLQRDRLERERQEQAVLVRDEERAHTRLMNQQQEAQRIEALNESRAHARRVEEDRREFEVGEADRRHQQALARQRMVADVAAGVRSAAQDRADQIYEAGVEGLANIFQAGQHKGVPYKLSVTHPDATAGDYAAVNRANVQMPTPEGPSATEQSSVRRAVAAAAEVVDEEGNVVDYRWDPYEQEQRAQAILRGENPGNWPESYAVPEPAFEPELIDTPGFRGWLERGLPFGATGSELSTPPVAADGGGPQGTRQPVPPPLDVTGPLDVTAPSPGQLDIIPPGIDPEEYRRMLDMGATPEEIELWIAQRAGPITSGRF